MPQYYDNSGKARSYAALKDYRMRMRWDVSGDRIAEFARTGE